MSTWKGIRRKSAKQMAMANEKSSVKRASCPCNRSAGRRCPKKKTKTPATAPPSKAKEMDMKAKWYHMVAEKTRVRAISNVKIAPLMPATPNRLR